MQTRVNLLPPGHITSKSNICSHAVFITSVLGIMALLSTANERHFPPPSTTIKPLIIISSYIQPVSQLGRDIFNGKTDKLKIYLGRYTYTNWVYAGQVTTNVVSWLLLVQELTIFTRMFDFIQISIYSDHFQRAVLWPTPTLPKHESNLQIPTQNEVITATITAMWYIYRREIMMMMC